MRLKTIKAYYPDARIIFIMRNPQQVVPSFFSLLYKSIEHRWGVDGVPEEVMARYNRRRYQSMIALYRYFHDLHQSGEMADNVLVLPYTALVEDLVGAYDKIIAFTGMPGSEALREVVKAKAAGQGNYQRKHSNIELERFGVTREMIAADFSFVFDTYGMSPHDY